jgi:trigger factor
MVLELRRSGFGEAEIRARENELRRNTVSRTATALKEHFILERIAEDLELDVDSGDYDAEIALIAMQSGESARRVRAQLEKRGLMDVLRNQIIERKVLALVREHAKFTDEPYEEGPTDVEAIDLAAGGGETESAIPSAEAAPAKAASEE